MIFTTSGTSKILKVVIIATVAALLVAVPTWAKKITIKMGNVDSPFKMTLSETNGEFASTDIKCQAFKKMVEAGSDGRIQVKIFPAGQLGGEREMLEMTKMGSLQMNGCSAAALATFVPEVMAIQIPYIFRDENVALKVLNGPVGAELNELIAKKMGMRIFAWNSEGYYNIGNTKKRIQVPGDLKGLKIRVPETPNMVEIIKLAGGVPTPISFTEVYTTMQQGVVDGGHDRHRAALHHEDPRADQVLQPGRPLVRLVAHRDQRKILPVAAARGPDPGRGSGPQGHGGTSRHGLLGHRPVGGVVPGPRHPGRRPHGRTACPVGRGH